MDSTEYRMFSKVFIVFNCLVELSVYDMLHCLVLYYSMFGLILITCTKWNIIKFIDQNWKFMDRMDSTEYRMFSKVFNVFDS